MMRFVRVTVAQFLGVIAVTVPVLTGCTDADAPKTTPEMETSNRESALPESAIVARVDGRPIALSEATRLIEEADGGLTPDEAVNVLVRNALLAEEAEKRGYNRAPETLAARQKASARVLLKEETEIALTAETLPESDVRAYYNANKQKYVHGERREVVHFLARTGKNRLSHAEALKVSEEASQAAQGAVDEADFRNRMKPFVESLKKNAVLEEIPPFEANSKKLVRPFVDGTFQLSEQGAVSPPVKTDFGYHVIYLASIEPAANRSIEEVEPEIREAALPKARIRKAKALVTGLMSRNKVFIYEDALKEGSFPQ